MSPIIAYLRREVFGARAAPLPWHAFARAFSVAAANEGARRHLTPLALVAAGLRPLIAPASNLGICNQGTLERLRAAYYRLPERERPRIEAAPASLQSLTQAQRFEGSIAILGRMIELWEDGQYIGWPS